MGDDFILHTIDDISIKIASIAIKSLLYELCHIPSFGLVCPISSGSHKDMDCFTFIDSSSSLIRSFILCAKAGFTNLSYEEIFKNIRLIGKDGERDMFHSTLGVNTHKGSLFILGILSAAISRCIYEKKDFFYIKYIVQEMTKGLTSRELLNLNNTSKLTHGEDIYIKYDIKGIRQEAEEGFPIIFNHSLKMYENFSNKSNNERLTHTLIAIMQHCMDTNIIYRNGIECLYIVQNKAKSIIQSRNITEEKQRKIDELNTYLLENNISPGGSADILSATIFLYEIKRTFFKNNEIY